MMGNGTATFANPDDYQAGIRRCECQSHRHGRWRFQRASDVVELAPSPRPSCYRKLTTDCFCLVVAGAGIRFVSNKRRAIPDIQPSSIAVRRRRIPQPRRANASAGRWSKPMGPYLAAAGATRRLQQGPDRIGNNRPIYRSRAATVAECRSALAAASFAGLPSRRDETYIDRESGSRASAGAGIASRACQLPDGRGCRRPSKDEAAPRRYHGPVRGCVDRASWLTAEHAGALRESRRSGTSLARLLHRIPGHGSEPVSFAAAIEHGALRIAACRPGNCNRR